MRIIIELIFIIILGSSIYVGRKKGLVSGIATVLSIIISICAANILANTFSKQLTDMIQPFVSGYMDGSTGIIGLSLDEITGQSDLSVEDTVRKNPESADDLCILCYEKMGMSTAASEKLAKKAIAAYDKGGISFSSAIISVMSSALSYALLFSIFFALAIIILTIIINLFNLSLKFPNMDKLNLIGGIASGAVIGIFFCSLTAWMIKFLGIVISQESLSGIAVSWVFMKLDMLSWILPC